MCFLPSHSHSRRRACLSCKCDWYCPTSGLYCFLKVDGHAVTRGLMFVRAPSHSLECGIQEEVEGKGLVHPS
eukprot:13723873-Alexandrium_andersonii.AAC.1